MAPPATPRSKTTGRYAHPTIQILVGDRREPFHVHYRVLEKTAFFEVHGYPTTPETPRPSPSRQATMNSPVPSDGTLGTNEVDIKLEEAEDERIDSAEAALSASAPVTPLTYTLKGIVYDPEAFEVIVNSLYSEHPNTPAHRAELRTLRKAYVLALKYRMEQLQDDIVECFRNFHVGYTVHFEDLLWLARRIGGDEAGACKVPIVQYLIEQCAYEIYREGYDAFTQHNVGFHGFLKDGNSTLRVEIFKAIAKIAMASQPTDPAVDINHWRVRDWPEYNPNAISGRAVDVIDLED